MALKSYSEFSNNSALIEPQPSCRLVLLSRTHVERWVAYPSAEIQSVYSSATDDWAELAIRNERKIIMKKRMLKRKLWDSTVKKIGIQNEELL